MTTDLHREIIDRLTRERDYWERARNEWEKSASMLEKENKRLIAQNRWNAFTGANLLPRAEAAEHEVERLTRERDQALMDMTNARAVKSDDAFDAYNDLASANKEIERLTRERDAAWKASAQSQEERCIALSNSIGFREQRDKALTVSEAAERKLAMAVEALRKLAKASARLSVAAQTTGGVAGRDEGLCAEIDRLAQPLGEARATLTALEKNDE